MKKLLHTAPPLIILSLVCSSSFAASPSASYNSCGGFEASVSAFHARANFTDLDYTIVDHQSFEDTFILPPQGGLKIVQPDYDCGYEAFVGYILPCNHNDILLSYRKYNTDEHDQVHALPGSFVWATNFPPDLLDDFNIGPGGDQATEASAKVDFDYHKWSLEYGHSMCLPSGFYLRFLIGIDNTNIERTVHRRYFDIELNQADLDGDPSIGLQNEKNDFDGWGPKVGCDVEYVLFPGLALAAHANTSLLIGSLDYHYFAEAVNEEGVRFFDNGFIELDTKYEDHVVPNINVKVGANYTYRFCNCTRSSLIIEVGYQVDHYFDAIHSINFMGVDDDNQSSYAKDQTGFGVKGPYLSVTLAI